MKNTDLFYDYFIAQHGMKAFERISDMIIKKVKDIRNPVENYMKKEDFLKGYVMIVFEIAITDFWGMNDEQSIKYLKMKLGENIITDGGLNRIKKIHKDAIEEIQYNFAHIENEGWEMNEDEKVINILFNNKLNSFSVGKWKRKDKEYKNGLENFYDKMYKLEKYTNKELTEKEKKEYTKILEDAKNSIYDIQIEEKRLYYIEGYKDGVSSMKELFDEI